MRNIDSGTTFPVGTYNLRANFTSNDSSYANGYVDNVLNIPYRLLYEYFYLLGLEEMLPESVFLNQ
jgi:hypothetical protein